jgi:hypothetical protein
MDRGQVQVLTNLGSQPAEFEVPEGYKLVAHSQPEVSIAESRIKLPPNTLAILSGEES